MVAEARTSLRRARAVRPHGAPAVHIVAAPERPVRPEGVHGPLGERALHEEHDHAREDAPHVQGDLLDVKGLLLVAQHLLHDQGAQGRQGCRHHHVHEAPVRHAAPRAPAALAAVGLHLAEGHGSDCNDDQRHPLKPRGELVQHQPFAYGRDRHVDEAQDCHDRRGDVAGVRHENHGLADAKQHADWQVPQDLPGVPRLPETICSMEPTGHQSRQTDPEDERHEVHGGGHDGEVAQDVLRCDLLHDEDGHVGERHREPLHLLP
mmetsp:Transcript_95457/g.291969  ORF Transcript_95457/g.291969 Transcript_95457/m.291969 type:complete len:263 (-) Transcript_95457:1650-2438(-)